MKEITLLGQNVNAYHGAGPSGKTWDLAQLLGALSNVDGIERLRFTTSHPNEMTDALIAAHRDLPKLIPYLHLPFQAGSDRILKAMNRKHTMADYFRIVEKLRRARPDLALSTDIIVGFPGESDTDFQETMQVVETEKYAQVYSFKYSAAPESPQPIAATRSARTSSPIVWPGCNPCSMLSRRRSTRAWWAADWTYFGNRSVRKRGRSSAGLPICKPCMPRVPLN